MVEATTDSITLLDTENEEVKEEVDYQHFETDREIEVILGTTAGNTVVTYTSHFVAASVDTETGEMEQAMGAPDRMNDARIFVSNEDGDLGAEVLVVEAEREETDDETPGPITETVGVEDAIDEFSDEYL